MIECYKRQRVIKKGEETFRCLNNASEAHRQQVSDNICTLCPVRAFKKLPLCKQRPSEIVKNSEVFDQETAELEKEMPDQEVPGYPKLSIQLWLYKEALLRWQKAGRPKRSNQEVESLLNTYCKKCDWYDTEKERCKGCGCSITTGSVAIFNKLRMATEHCPRNLW